MTGGNALKRFFGPHFEERDKALSRCVAQEKCIRDVTMETHAEAKISALMTFVSLGSCNP